MKTSDICSELNTIINEYDYQVNKEGQLSDELYDCIANFANSLQEHIESEHGQEVRSSITAEPVEVIISSINNLREYRYCEEEAKGEFFELKKYDFENINKQLKIMQSDLNASGLCK
ncbi:TPA: hypothetical protein QCY03_003706 [Bacillus tropicus]|nr:hypothetical protein [Bacillus tropicus]